MVCKNIFFIFLDSKKYEIILEFTELCRPTLQDLAEEITKQCGVPVHKQKLISKGMVGFVFEIMV